MLIDCVSVTSDWRDAQLLADLFGQQIINIVVQRYNGSVSKFHVYKLGVAAFLPASWQTVVKSQMFQEFLFFHAFTVSLL